MTERLYDQGHTLQFTATVLSCVPEKDYWLISLDRTAFFPGGGGQVCDSGTLNCAQVIGMRESAGEILHLTDAPLTVGTLIDGRLDSEPRLRRMQNHSGEHILSGLFWREYGLTNVGFHMGSEDVTLDLNGELTHAQLMHIETMANAIVRQNLPVTVSYPDAATLSSLDYRSKLELTENVRIVSIGEHGAVDRCACCAPHVEQTGEIGIIKILDHIRYKGGIRIHILCGLDALEDYRTKHTAVSSIASALSAKQAEVVSAVDRLSGEISAERARHSLLCNRLIDLHISALSPHTPAIIFEELFNANELRRLVNTALTVTPTAIALAGDDTNGYLYVLGSSTESCRTISRAMHDALGGKGGGSDAMVQGRLASSRDIIEHWWSTR